MFNFVFEKFTVIRWARSGAIYKIFTIAKGPPLAAYLCRGCVCLSHGRHRIFSPYSASFYSLFDLPVYLLTAFSSSPRSSAYGSTIIFGVLKRRNERNVCDDWMEIAMVCRGSSSTQVYVFMAMLSAIIYVS